MNIVQIGDKLRDLPISILRSEDIVLILSKVNDVVPEESQISASNTGNDIFKLFNSVSAEAQSKMLEDIFNSRRESVILTTIIEEAQKQTRKDETAKHKWSAIQASILLIGVGVLLMVVWSFMSQFATKPPVPDAVVGNLVAELLKSGVDMLIAYLQTSS